jgi:hypothetical protein
VKKPIRNPFRLLATARDCEHGPDCRMITERLRCWPIRFRVGEFSHWFTVHGIEVEPDTVPHDRHSYGMMPGYRRRLAWVLHLGRLKVVFGKAKPISVGT